MEEGRAKAPRDLRKMPKGRQDMEIAVYEFQGRRESLKLWA
jgi:hypothetical protein